MEVDSKRSWDFIYMIRTSGLVGVVVLLAGAATLLDAQRSSAPKANQLQVVAVVGCVAPDGDNWALINASGPLVVPTADGKAQTGSGVTVERAKAEPVGKERYRLMNMLNEFGVANHKGQKVLVRGLILGDGNQRRINLVSFEAIEPNCGRSK
jgi:hypothetical protein